MEISRKRALGFAGFLVGVSLLGLAVYWIPTFLDRKADRDAELAQTIAEGLAVPGTILSSELDKKCSGFHATDDKKCWWRMEVNFAYEANGSRYTDEQGWKVGDAKGGTFPKSNTLSSGDRNAISVRYAPGETIIVHYHPSDPGRPWLDSTPPRSDDWWILGIVFAFFGFCLTLIGVSELWPQSESG